MARKKRKYTKKNAAYWGNGLVKAAAPLLPSAPLGPFRAAPKATDVCVTAVRAGQCTVQYDSDSDIYSVGDTTIADGKAQLAEFRKALDFFISQ